MNQFSILLHLLTRSKASTQDPSFLIRGETMDNICSTLGFTSKTRHIEFFELLQKFSRYIQPLGLQMKQNLFNRHWFLIQESSIQNWLHANPFADKKSLGATMAVIISLSLLHGQEIDFQLINQYRKKKSLDDDLTKLHELRFIIRNKNKVKLHPNLGYYLDFNKFDLSIHDFPE
jgi:hypothetical protein